MTHPIKYSAVLGDYYYNDKSNFAFAGIEAKLPLGRGSAGMFNGVAVDEKGKFSYVLDFKGSMNYDKSGYVGQNVRVRNNFSEGAITTQIRFSPCTVNLPVGKSTSIYLNPHVVTKYNYNTKGWQSGAGAFLGVTQNLGKGVNLSAEVQRYNLQIFNQHDGNWSANLIFTKSF